MLQKKILIKGAFILTVTSLSAKIIGFFYRIFLSRTFGEENVGLYQLIFPVYALGISLTCAGIQTAISRCVAGKSAIGKHNEARQILYIGLGLSVSVSLIVMFLTQQNAEFIAGFLLQEKRCTSMLILLSYSFPFASIHSCISGYYIGLKNASIPAGSQLLEQIMRVMTVYIICRLLTTEGGTPGISVAVTGLITGEMASAGLCFYILRCKHKISCTLSDNTALIIRNGLSDLLKLSVPLTCNRVLLNILQSIEAVSIPVQLRTYGLTTSESLSMYGVLTGMAFPCILFPSAVTNSIASMMLPAIAELQASGKKEEMVRMIKKAGSSCFLIGIICCAGLLITGRPVGNLIFHSKLAGDFLITLAWICPFLYTNSNLISIINGLGKTNCSFLFNMVSLTIRILGVFLIIPFLGINGYLWGLLVSQLVLFSLCIIFLKRYFL